MSESKLTSVLPNNSIKGSMVRMPVSTVYVENSNNISSLEDIMYANDREIGFPNASFGTTYNFNFSRGNQFLKQIIFRAKFASATTFKSDYAMYNLLANIRYTVGGTELLTLDSQSMVNIVLDQCESEKKRLKVLELAGRVQTLPANGAHFFYAIIPLPWSNIGAKDPIKGLPLHMLNEPIEVQITLAPSVDVISAGSIQSADLMYRYGKLGSPDELKNSVYRYPFISRFSHKKHIAATTFNAAAGGEQARASNGSIELNSFRKGEITQIQLHAITNTNVAAKRFNNGQKLKNLRLVFNGQVIWRAEQTGQEIWDIVDNHLPCVHNPEIVVIKNHANNGPLLDFGNTTAQGYSYGRTRSAGAINDAPNFDINRFYYYNIPIAEILDKYQKQGHYLGADFTKQSVQLEFDGLFNDPEAPTAVEAGILYLTYSYRALYQFDGESALLVY